MTGLIRLFMALNIFLYRLSGGRLGGRIAGQPVLLLQSVGRKSGKTHTTPLAFCQDGDNYVVVAANMGRTSHPGWYYNLSHQASTTIQVGARQLPVNVRLAGDGDYARLWKWVTERNHNYLHYQEQAGRKFPIVVLEPAA